MITVVEAKKIDSKHIYFTCPYCRTKYKKDGTPTLRSKPVVHKHGNFNPDFSNRIEHRTGHCIYNKSDFDIHITDNTFKNKN
jgi:hypothetical protein